MKSLIIVTALVLGSFSAHAGTQDKLAAAIKKSASSGKMIKINGNNVYGIDLADGTNVDSSLDAQVAANLLCDFSKNWQAQDDTIRCIAK